MNTFKASLCKSNLYNVSFKKLTKKLTLRYKKTTINWVQVKNVVKSTLLDALVPYKNLILLMSKCFCFLCNFIERLFTKKYLFLLINKVQSWQNAVTWKVVERASRLLHNASISFFYWALQTSVIMPQSNLSPGQASFPSLTLPENCCNICHNR